MVTCGHEECYISTPPTLDFLLENFPLITPDETIDRSIPRCRLCDLIATSQRESSAVYPPPTYSSAIEGLQNHIASTEKLVAEGTLKHEFEATLPSMKKMLEDEIRATELRMLEAWKGHWAIWGSGEGLEIAHEYPEEEELEGVTGEKPRTVVGKKRKASCKIKGRAAKKVKRDS